MRNIISELSDEDDYGSWELWWRVAQDCPNRDKDELMNEFVRTIAQLVQEGQLKAKQRREPSGRLEAALLDTDVLLHEVNMSHTPNPDTFYWFGK